MKKIFALVFWLTAFCSFGQEGYYNTLLRIVDNVPVPNQVTSRTIHVPFTDAVNNDWQGRYDPIKLSNGNIVAVWIESPDHSAATNASTYVNIHFSGDDGATWSDNNEDLAGNPVAGFPLTAGASTGFIDKNFILCPNGDLILILAERGSNASWNATNVTWQLWRSTDDGITWAYESDFPDLVGIADNAKVHGVYESMVVNDRIYIPFMEIRTDLNDARIRLFKSDDNGVTWDFVSNPVEYDEYDPQITESSIANLGGNRFHCIFRTQNLGNAVSRESFDGGVTWTPIVDFASNIGYVGVHQPRVKQFTDFYILMGRDSKPALDDIANQYHGRSAFWTTTTLFSTPSRRQWLDPYYDGPSGTDNNDGDAGYTKYFLKDDGTFMFFGYWGDNFAARIYKYDVSHTNTQSNEQYSNTPLNGFDVRTITTAGVRLQMNRDNVYVPAGSTNLTLPQGSISRVHNTLNHSATWICGTGVQFTVENNEGWIKLDAGSVGERVESDEGVLGQDFANNTFTVSFWLRPDDGHPPATERILSIVSGTSTALDNDHFIIQQQTDGNFLFRYAEDTGAGVFSDFTTGSPIFADGATTPKHIACVVPSGGTMTVYVDGVAVANDGVDTGNMAGITMSSFTTTQDIIIGARNNVGTYDLRMHGLIREFIILKDKACNATEIGNIRLN